MKTINRKYQSIDPEVIDTIVANNKNEYWLVDVQTEFQHIIGLAKIFVYYGYRNETLLFEDALLLNNMEGFPYYCFNIDLNHLEEPTINFRDICRCIPIPKQYVQDLFEISIAKKLRTFEEIELNLKGMIEKCNN